MANQLPDTQQRVVFSAAHLVPLSEVKQLGLYSKSHIFDGTIGTLLTSLRYIFSPEEILIPDQKIAIRLQNDVHERILTTDSRPLSSLDESQLRDAESTLFPADYVVLLLQLAKYLQLYAPTELLHEFYEQYDIRIFLKQWGGGIDSPTQENPTEFIFSEETLRNNCSHIQTLLVQIEDAFALITNTIAAPATEEETQQTESGSLTPTQLAVATAALATNVNSEQAQEVSEQQAGASPEHPGTLTTQEKISIEKQVSWIWAAARQQLIFDTLKKLGIDPANPPEEMRGQIILLEDLLRRQIRDITLSLPQDKLTALINGTGSIHLRIELLRTLLISLYQGESARFFTELFTLYELCKEHALKTNQEYATEIIVENLEQIINEHGSELSPTQSEQLREIKEEIQKWKEAFLKSVNKPEKTQLQTTDTIEELALEEKLETIEPTPPVLKFHLPPADSERLDVVISEILPKPFEQKRIQNQVARLIAGTKAELFSEKDLSRNEVPSQFTTQLSNLAIQYVLSLSPDELTKLSHSPSTLVRHIKTLYLKALQDTSFAEKYQEYQKAHLAPVQRNEIIEEQTAALSSVLIDELFTNQTITDSSTPDNYLQKEFDHLKNYVETKIYYTVSELTTDDLIKLQLDFNQQKNILKIIHTELNRDNVFISEVNHFYSSLASYYETSGQLEKKAELENSLQISLTNTSGSYRLTAVDPEQATKLFNMRLSTIIKTDNPAIASGAATIVDSMLLTYGRDNTAKLISNLSPELLTLTLGLPKGSIEGQNVAELRSLLLAHAQTREVLFSLYKNTSDPLSDDPPPGQGKEITIAQLNKYLSPVQAVSQLSSQEGSDAVAAATDRSLLKKQQKVIKGLMAEWSTLSYQQQYALYYFTVQIQKDPTVPMGPGTAALLSKEKANKVRKNQHDVTEQLEFISSYLFLRAEMETIVDQFLKDSFSKQAALASVETELDQIEYEQASLAYQQRLALHLEFIKGEIDDIQQQEQAAVLSPLAAAYTLRPLDARAVANAPEIPEALAEGAPPSRGGSRRSRALAGVKSVAKKRLKKKLAAGATTTAAKAALGATAGVVTAGASLALTGAQSLWKFIKNPDENPGLLFAIALPMAPLFTVGGLLAFGLTTFFTGNIVLGLLAAPVGAYILPWPIPGLNFRLPPAPWQNTIGTGMDQTVHANSPSLSQMRQEVNQSANAASSQAAQNSQSQTSGATSPQASTAATTSATTQSAAFQSAQSLSSTMATSTAATTSSSGMLFGLSLSVFGPLGGIITMMGVSIFVLIVIFGAFLIPVPTRPTSNTAGDIVGSTTSKYIEVTKVANPAKIENNAPTSIEYTITIKPKPTYMIKIKDIKDAFSGFGTSTTIPTSPLKLEEFTQEPIPETATLEKKYTVMVGENTVDALIMNAFTLTFDVLDSSNFVLATDETITAAASIVVGNPKVGCWPASGKIWQLPYGSFSHGNLDAFDIGNSIGTPVYAPFPGKLCDKGWDPKRKADGSPGGYGRYASLEFSTATAPNLVLYFSHFTKGPKELSEGFDSAGCKIVQPGELIGLMDDTGYSFGSHLHYELLKNNYGVRLQDLVIDGAQVISKDKSGQAVFVNHCFK